MAQPLKSDSQPFGSPAEVFSWMESFTNLEARVHNYSNRTYRLDRMRYLLGLCGNPHQNYPIFHVAGSKGKGSTASLIAGALTANGFKTGLYTSPHISSYLERITISGNPADTQLLIKLGNQLHTLIAEINLKEVSDYSSPTTFELLTLLAFLTYRDAGCEYVVLEVGLGGRLDATNVVIPVAAVITPIEREHAEILGDTPEKIAYEKAGIMKPGVPVFSSHQTPGVREVLQQCARQHNAPLHWAAEETEITALNIRSQGTFFNLTTTGQTECRVQLSLLGRFQAENAALAFLTLVTCLPQLTPRLILEGFYRTRLPGRMELFSGSPAFILDGAHTPLSMQLMLELFCQLFPGDNILIFGSVLDKDHLTLAGLLAERFKHIIISTPGTFKPSNLPAIYQSFRQKNPCTNLEPNNLAALTLARELAGKLATDNPSQPPAVLVTGSFYLVAEFRKFLV